MEADSGEAFRKNFFLHEPLSLSRPSPTMRTRLSELNSFMIRIHSYLTGVISVLANVRQFNDLGHPLCRNLRDGDWLMDYTVSRLLPFVGTRQVSTHWA